MTLQVYIDSLRSSLDRLIVTPLVMESDLRVDQRSGDQAFIQGAIHFHDSSTLHFKEFIDAHDGGVDKLTYSYHYQSVDNELIFRYDNAAHKPPLAKREHKHTKDGIISAPSPLLRDVTREILIYLESLSE